MTTRATAKTKNKKPLETTLGKAPQTTSDDPIDLSHIRKPIDTSIFGLRQVLQLFETATDEVRRYVSYECDIMYECRMCRTIFRSLANFVLHKRNYCRESYNRNDHTNCRNSCQESESYVTQEEVDPLGTSSKDQNSGSNSPIPPKCDSKQTTEHVLTDNNSNQPEKKNLNYVLRRLQGRQQSTLITEQCLSEDVSNESKDYEKEDGKNNVALHKITDSTSGVFQTMFRSLIGECKGDVMRTEVMEIHNILENNEAILGSDGKIVASESEKSADFICTVCNQKFSTKKTLTYHIKYKHNNTRLIYQCPECNDTFANAWSVFRHLYKIHRKTTAQVKRLRNQIHANIIRRDQKPVPKNDGTARSNSEPSDLQEKADIENQWMDDLEGDNDLQRCGGCGRKFERKAALHSHSQFCSKRIAVCNSIKENSTKRVQVEEKQMDKPKNPKATSTTNVDNVTKGSRRRKQLISQKMCRVDYVKDNEISETTNEDSQDSELDFQDQDNKEIEKDGKNSNEICKKSKGEVRVENNDLETEEFVLIQNLEELEKKDENDKMNNDHFKPNITTVLIVEEPQSVSRSESRCSDSNDIIYVDTVRLSPTIPEIADLIEPITDLNEDLEVQVSPAITKNSIITRSKKNVILNSENKNSEAEENCTVENSRAPQAPIGIKLVDISKLTGKNEGKLQYCSDNTLQTESSKNYKRKGIEPSQEPQAGNSKRKKVAPKDVQTKTPKITLETKSLKYIDKQKHNCLPCKKTFKSHKLLLKHMAIHFNWYRYQCRSCSYMSYSRSKCNRHVEAKHAIHDEETLKNTVLHIPTWKTIDKATDFRLFKKHKIKVPEVITEQSSVNTLGESQSEVHKEVKEEVQKDVDLVAAPSQQVEKSGDPTKSAAKTVKDDTSSGKPDVQDPSVRKMIMEVIFGNQNERSTTKSEVGLVNQHEKKPLNNLDHKCEDLLKTDDATEDFRGFHNSEVQDTLSLVVLKENPRPVRNRVPTVQKDFLYDMTQILKPKGAKDKEIPAVGTQKEVKYVKKHKQMKTYTKETKPKPPIQLTIANGKKPVNKSVQRVVLESHVTQMQDVMSSKDLLKKHVTGD